MAGRSGQVYTDWIAEREQQWREQIRIAALDPYRGYTTALATTLPEATRVLDAFHIATLANKIVNETGQRIQQATLGHRGRKGDPLYEIRRLLHRGIETLSDAQRRQVNLGLQVSHPPSAVTVAWATAQQLRSLSHPPPRPSAELGRSPRSPRSPSCPAPEVAHLDRTLRTWRTELLAYFDTASTCNRPTETINLLIEKRRRNPHGFRNFANHQLRLLLAHGPPYNHPPTAQIKTHHPHSVA